MNVLTFVFMKDGCRRGRTSFFKIVRSLATLQSVFLNRLPISLSDTLLQDVGVVITCTEAGARCKTVSSRISSTF